MPVLNPTIHSIDYMEREKKDNKYKEEQTGPSRLSIPRYNLSFLFCIPNMNFLSYIVVEIALTIKCGEKEKRAYTRKIKLENAASQSHDTTCRCLPVY